MTAGPALPARNGFTLVELMVALFVFGLLASAGVYLLRTSADGQAILADRLAENGDMVRLATLVRTDLASALARPGRDAGGAPLPAFVVGGGVPGALFAVSRLAAPDMDGAASPDVSRVGYAFSDGAIRRLSWPMPDGSGQPEIAAVAEGIAGVALRYRGGDGDWRDGWTARMPGDLPRAVSLDVTGEDGTRTQIVAAVGPQLRAASPLLSDAVSGDAPKEEEQ